MTDRELAYEQSAFWYLAGLEDATPGVSEHGPVTPWGKAFIRAYVDACQEADGTKQHWPYLPNFYRERCA